MTGASLCFVGGAIAPQLVDWPRISDLTSAPEILLDHPWLVATLGIVAAGILAYLPRVLRRSFACLLAGSLAYWLHAELLLAGQLSPELEGESLLVEVVVPESPRHDGMTTSLVAMPVDDERIPRRLRLTWVDAPVTVRAGDRWRLEARLRRPRGSHNPGGMDFEGWLFRDRVGATGYVVNGVHNHLLSSGRPGFLRGVRQRFIDRTVSVVGPGDSAGVLVAIIVGARHLIRPDQWDRYAETGTSHLMAISGLHIGLAASGAYLIVLALSVCSARQFARRDVALGAALVAAVAYACVSGMALPARRATIMLACVTVMLLLRREPNAGPVLAFAALAIGVLDPVSTMAPGFRLSFAAVATLVWLSLRRPTVRAPERYGADQVVAGLVTVQLALFLGLMPLTIQSFGRIALPAPLLNLVAVPIFSLATVPLGLIALILDGPFAIAGDWFLGLAAATIDLLEVLIGHAAAAGGSSRVAGIEGAAWVALVALFAWTLLPPGWPGRWISWLAVVFIVAWRPAAPATGCVRASILDVGQGLAVVLETRSRVVLFDAGPRYRNGSSAGENVVLPYLRSRGIPRVDLAVISHPDIDHAGGLAAIAAALPVGDIVAGNAGLLSDVAARPCILGQRWAWDGVEYTILSPPGEGGMTRNDASCVLLVAAGETRLLFTGDIEKPAETRLVERRALPVVDLATVPHHGSRTSSTMPFVLELRPDYAIVSAARHNQWGFPKPDVVSRWRAAGAQVLNTGISGAILVDACDEDRGIAVREYRSLYRRIWHADN